MWKCSFAHSLSLSKFLHDQYIRNISHGQYYIVGGNWNQFGQDYSASYGGGPMKGYGGNQPRGGAAPYNSKNSYWLFLFIVWLHNFYSSIWYS